MPTGCCRTLLHRLILLWLRRLTLLLRWLRLLLRLRGLLRSRSRLRNRCGGKLIKRLCAADLGC